VGRASRSASPLPASAPADLKEYSRLGRSPCPSPRVNRPDEGCSVYAPNLGPPRARAEGALTPTGRHRSRRPPMSLFAAAIGLAPDFFAADRPVPPLAAGHQLPARDKPRRCRTSEGPARTPTTARSPFLLMTRCAAGISDANVTWAPWPPVPGAFVSTQNIATSWPAGPTTLLALHSATGGRAAWNEESSAPGGIACTTSDANWSARITFLPTCLAPARRPPVYEPVLAGPAPHGQSSGNR